MAKISSVRNFQYKIVKSVVLSILIPASIILFSGWYFFGGMSAKSDATTTATNNTDSCKGMTKEKCNLDTCSWDPDQNMCFSSK